MRTHTLNIKCYISYIAQQKLEKDEEPYTTACFTLDMKGKHKDMGLIRFQLCVRQQGGVCRLEVSHSEQQCLVTIWEFVCCGHQILVVQNWFDIQKLDCVAKIHNGKMLSLIRQFYLKTSGLCYQQYMIYCISFLFWNLFRTF